MYVDPFTECEYLEFFFFLSFWDLQLELTGDWHYFHYLLIFALQAIVICFRLHYSKDNTTSNTASAVVQQVVTMVFERVMAEDEANAGK